MQYRHVRYKLGGTLADQRIFDQYHVFNFFNPKGGLYFAFDKKNECYFSFGIANREPSRDNYKDADISRNPVPETLYDYEAGYSFKMSNFSAGANLYYMSYHNQLILTGQINNVGEAIMVNVPHSYRAGIELSAGLDLLQKKLQINANATFSRNRILNFTEYVDTYDPDWTPKGQDTIHHGETGLSFSPNVIVNGIITYNPYRNLSISLNSRYIGRQYIDNTSNINRSLHDCFVTGAILAYTVKAKIFREIGFNLTINNIFSQKYETNGWVYPYYIGNQYKEDNGYFPQAPVNFLFGISLKI